MPGLFRQPPPRKEGPLPRTTPRPLLASILGAAGILLWATETALITVTVSIPPLQTVALSFAFAGLLSPAVWLITGGDPLEAFRQPPRVWLLTVGSLVGYHASIYYATQKAPPAAAALLQGTTPLIIVLGSALLPGERLRWWHVAGALLGFCGVLSLIDGGGEAASPAGDHSFHLGLIGIAAGLWGLYSVVSRRFGEVPSSTLGVFYVACALVSLAGHLAFETWVQPEPAQWAAIAALGLLPMGLAIYLWDHGIKHGDIQALGAFSYVEPFAGAVLVAVLGQGSLNWTLFWAGCLVIGGAMLASMSLWRKPVPGEPPGGAAGNAPPLQPEPDGGRARCLVIEATRAELL